MTDQEWSDSMYETFKFSFDEFSADLDRAVSLQNTYDNVVDEDAFPTRSKIPLPLAWATVEEATGPAMDYLFPPQPAIRMFTQENVDPDTTDKVQWALHLMMIHRMGLKLACVRSVKDCFKLGVGLGIVEPITVTPPVSFDVVAGGNRARMMGRGRAVRSLRYRYVSNGRMVPYPQGVDFNGIDPTPYTFFLDLIPEAQFRKLFAARERSGEDVLLKGNKTTADEIIDEARRRGFYSQTTLLDYTDKLGGRKSYGRGMGSAKKNVPCMVPVMKVFATNEARHTWFSAVSRDWSIIWDKKDSYDTLRNPMIKWDAWLDADRWWPMSQPEADERTTHGKNILVNAIMDLINQNVKRPLLWNKAASDDPPDMNGGVIGLEGDVRATATYMDPPSIDAGTFRMLEEIDRIHAGNTGQRDFTARNFTRGGSMAFQDLLQSSGGRDKLRYMLLQTGGFESVARQVMLYMQTLGGDMNLKFQRPVYNQTAGKEYVESFGVTEDDLKHGWDLMMDFDSKFRKGSMDAQMQQSRAQFMLANPNYFDAWEVARDFCQDDYEAQRKVLPRDVVRRRQEERQQAELAATQAQAAPAGEEAAPMNPAVAGAMMGGAQ